MDQIKALWKLRMRTYLITCWFDIWGVVNNGYTTPTTPPGDATRKRINENNAKAMNAILRGLAKS